MNRKLLLICSLLSLCFFSYGQDTDNTGMKQRDTVYTVMSTVTDVKPLFLGGSENNFTRWVNTQLQYPEDAKRKMIEGRVFLQFTVTTDGSVTNVKVLRCVWPSLDKEAVRVVSKSPKWKPGIYKGKPANVIYNFQVIFQLTK